ncbi:MAG TPA: anti-sigma factor [Candidatus Dormibacteraeota bacterium]
MRSEHELLEESVAGYLLGAADPAEAQTARAHIEACASCRELAARLSRAVGALPLAVEEVQPPSRLRERILAAAAVEAPTPAAPASRNLARPRLLRPDFTSKLEVQRWRWLPQAAAAVALLAVGVAAGFGVKQATAPAVAAAHYSIRGSGTLQAASATVVDFRGTATTIVEFRGLPAAAEGKVYELWLIPSGANPIASGVFVPDADGSKVLVLPRDLAGVAVMAVTVEPGPDGSTQPTQQPELSGSVT